MKMSGAFERKSSVPLPKLELKEVGWSSGPSPSASLEHTA